MPTVNTTPASVNEVHSSALGGETLPEDQLFLARNTAVEAVAMATAVVDALADLPVSVENERRQALANICERISKETLAALKLLMKERTPAT